MLKGKWSKSQGHQGISAHDSTMESHMKFKSGYQFPTACHLEVCRSKVNDTSCHNMKGATGHKRMTIRL